MWQTCRVMVSLEDFTFSLPLLLRLQAPEPFRAAKELWQFQKAFSLKTVGWSVSRLRCKILLECLKKLGLLRLAEKAFQRDQHTQRRLLYNNFSLSVGSIPWSKNPISACSRQGLGAAEHFQQGERIGSASATPNGTHWGLFRLQGRRGPERWLWKTVVWCSKEERCSCAGLQYRASPHFVCLGVRHQPIFLWFFEKLPDVELWWHCRV